MAIEPMSALASKSWQDLTESELSPDQKAEYQEVIRDIALDIMIDPTEILMED